MVSPVFASTAAVVVSSFGLSPCSGRSCRRGRRRAPRSPASSSASARRRWRVAVCAPRYRLSASAPGAAAPVSSTRGGAGFSPPLKTEAIAPKNRRRMQVAVVVRLRCPWRSTRCRPSTGVRRGHRRSTTSTCSQPSVASLPRQAADLGRDDVVRRREPLRLVALGRRLHERRPDRHRDVGGEAVGRIVCGWSKPTQTPVSSVGVKPTNQASLIVVGGAGLAGRRQREAEAAGARRGAGVDDVGHHARHQVGGRCR